MAKKKMGAPRKHNYEEITEKLYEWSALDDSINLCHFCCVYLDPPITPDYFCDMANRDENLSKAYKIARSRIGARRENKLNKGDLHVKAYDLNAPTYDYFMKQEKRAEKQFDHNLKKQEIEQEKLNLSDVVAELKKSAENNKT